MIVLAVAATPSVAAVSAVDFTLSPNVNDYWVEVSTTASPSAVTASINGGPPIPLSHQWWGSWATSTHVAAGSSVVFTATVNGQSVSSSAFTWPAAAAPAQSTAAPADNGGHDGGWHDGGWHDGGFAPPGSSSSTSAGTSAAYSQRVDIPTENVIAALALGNSPYYSMYYPPPRLQDIANVQQTGTASQYANQNVALNPNDALVAAALGGPYGYGGYPYGYAPRYGYATPAYGYATPAYGYAYATPTYGYATPSYGYATPTYGYATPTVVGTTATATTGVAAAPGYAYGAPTYAVTPPSYAYGTPASTYLSGAACADPLGQALRLGSLSLSGC